MVHFSGDHARSIANTRLLFEECKRIRAIEDALAAGALAVESTVVNDASLREKNPVFADIQANTLGLGEAAA